MWRHYVLVFASTNLWGRQARWMMVLLLAGASGCWSMDILSTDALIVHSDNVSAISTDVSLLVLVRALQALEVFTVICTAGVPTGSGVFCLIATTGPATSDLAMWMMPMYAWEFFRWLWIASRGLSWPTVLILVGIHAQLLVHIVHILWCSKVLQNIRNILIIRAGVGCSTSQCSLVVHTSVPTFDSDVAQVVRIN